jgi:hypothetical protein
MNEQERWQLITDLDEGLLKEGVTLSEWSAFLVRDADTAFASGADLAAILTALAAVESHLKYEWGDEMAGVLFYCSNHPIETGLKIPVAVVTSELNRDGFTSLVRDEMLECPDDWLFADLNAAISSLQHRLSSSREAK